MRSFKIYSDMVDNAPEIGLYTDYWTLTAATGLGGGYMDVSPTESARPFGPPPPPELLAGPRSMRLEFAPRAGRLADVRAALERDFFPGARLVLEDSERYGVKAYVEGAEISPFKKGMRADITLTAPEPFAAKTVETVGGLDNLAHFSLVVCSGASLRLFAPSHYDSTYTLRFTPVLREGYSDTTAPIELSSAPIGTAWRRELTNPQRRAASKGVLALEGPQAGGTIPIIEILNGVLYHPDNLRINPLGTKNLDLLLVKPGLAGPQTANVGYFELRLDSPWAFPMSGGVVVQTMKRPFLL